MVLCSVLNVMYVQPRPQTFSLENGRGRCYSDMGIPFSYYLSYLGSLRVRDTGDAHITRVLGMGMPISP